MLSENIQALRRAKGLSQEELAVKVNVVRQTVSKWEHGLSVPDTEMLVTLSDVLEVPVSTLLGETAVEDADEPGNSDLKALAEKLEVVNLQLARSQAARRGVLHWAFVIICALTIVCLIVLASMGSPYLAWDFSDPETAVAGTLLHGSEWLFVRLAPFMVVGSVAGMVMTRASRYGQRNSR